MRNQQLETWVIDIVDRVLKKQPIEDSRVELKSEWPDTTKTARRIAAHANSARGGYILWILGIDEEKREVTGIERKELSTWIAKVDSNFQGIHPSLVKDLVVPINDVSVLALLFDTNRTPYIVKNPSFGSPKGGPVEYEVPWREGTSTRTAKRSDLLRILSPIQGKPEFEVLNGVIRAREDERNKEPVNYYEIEVVFYVEPPSNQTIIIPFHRCKAKFKFSESDLFLSFEEFRLKPKFIYSSSGGQSTSKTIEVSYDEVFINGPGKIELSGYIALDDFIHEDSRKVNVYLELLPTNTDSPINLELNFEKGPDKGWNATWEVV